MQDCEEKYRETLEAIQFGVNLMHLHVSNLTDYQLLKYQAFVVQEQVFNTKESIKDAVRM